MFKLEEVLQQRGVSFYLFPCLANPYFFKMPENDNELVSFLLEPTGMSSMAPKANIKVRFLFIISLKSLFWVSGSG